MVLGCIPAGGCTVSKHRDSRGFRVGSGQEVFEISGVGSGRVGLGRVRRYLKYQGLGRVGSGRFQIPRVGWGHAAPTRPARNGATREMRWRSLIFFLCVFLGGLLPWPRRDRALRFF